MRLRILVSHREATLSELILLRSSSFNWFQLIAFIEEQGIDKTATERSYEALIREHSLEERKIVANSHEAYLCVMEEVMPDGNRDVAALNGDIVSESEHKDPDLMLTTRNIEPS